jgi:hypothetical protein
MFINSPPHVLDRRCPAVPSGRSRRGQSLRKLILFGALAASLFASLSSAAFASTSSIVDRLSTDKSAVETVSLPVGTKLVKVAVMKNLAGEGVTYKTISITQVRYTPPSGYPVVDLQAATSTGAAIGGWAGRRLTTPLETQQQREARELKEREVKEQAEREAKEKAEREAKEKLERETKEAAEREARELEERARVSSSMPMRVGLDAGGWAWSSAVKDVAGAVHFVRSGYGNYNSDSQMQLLASNGITLMPLFRGGSSIGAIDRTSFAGNVVNWFKRYGHGGTFWAGKTDLGGTTAEILNEPGNPYFWSDPGNYSAYAGLIEAVQKALTVLPEADRPRLLVSYDGGFGGDSYGRALVKTDPNLLNLGLGWTVHPYGGKSSTSSSALGNHPRVTEAYADTHQPVYVTEVGWPTAVGKEATGDSLQWSETQQATNIKEFVLWARSLGYVDAVIDFNYADYGTNNWYGIVDTTGTKHKLAYDTLKSLAAEG